ncbi:MAG: HlyD family efflux transporter periplasmic adaptor subunit [Candidatus Delongbacteria bacterium]|nr:HlyD family efflux transporter periplasmic adaptor subunit [Candidatus Delongbacteria bacterium]
MRITVKNSLSIATIMVVFLIFITVLLSLMKIDRKVIVPGTFTYRNISPVIIEENGFVEKICAEENEQIEKNDTILVLRNKDIEMEITNCKSRINIYKIELEEILQLKEYDTSINSFDVTKLKEELELKKVEETYYKNTYLDKKDLYEKKIISKDDYEEAELIYEQTKLESRSIKIQIDELTRILQKLDASSLLNYNLKQKELELEENTLNYLKNRKEMLVVKAKMSGKLLADKLENHLNVFLSQGDQIADVVSYDKIDFIGYAVGADIIRVKKDQEVVFNVDTFRGKDFIHGKVKRIGLKTAEKNGVISYPVEIEVLSKEFFDRGRKRFIHAGVAGEAIIMTERDIPIVELLWERIIKYADFN